MAGIAYNPKTVPADQAPKSWKDVLDPKWAGQVSVKVSNSGLEHETWYELKRLYGDDYLNKLGDLKPRAFDSYVQQYDRMVNGAGQDHPHGAVFRLSAIQGDHSLPVSLR